MFLAPVSSDLKAYILEAILEFSVCICEIVFIKHEDNFLARGCNKNHI